MQCRFTFRLIFFFLFLMNVLSAQKEMVDTAVFRKIRVAELNSSQVPLLAHYLTDVAGSRLTNSTGFFRAANWSVEIMKKWGLVNAGLEPWGEYGRGWDLESFSISMKEPYAGYVIGYASPWSSNTPGEITAAVYPLSLFNLTDSLFLEKHKSEIKGKIILVNNPFSKRESDFEPFSSRLTDSELLKLPDTYMYTYEQVQSMVRPMSFFNRGKKQLKSLGALALIGYSNAGRDGTVTVQALSGYEKNSPVLLPEAVISSEDGSKMKRLLESGHPVVLNLNIRGKFFDSDTKGYNVIAEIPGSDPKLKSQLVMLGAHLDSWNAATGATDNAAGCVVMMEAVRLLDSLHLKPKRTIRIALWSGEEQAVYGSYNYVKNHFRNPSTGLVTPEQARVSAYFNLDNGTGKIRGIYSQGDSAIQPIFEQWFAPFHDLGAGTVTLSSTGSTDHSSFDWAGIPAFQFVQDPLDYESKTHHTNMDTYDYLNIDDLKQASIIVASLIYQAAIRPDLLPRKKLRKETFTFEGL